VTLPSLRDADAERLTNPGERLLGVAVATLRRTALQGVGRADRVGAAVGVVATAIGCDLAGGSD